MKLDFRPVVPYMYLQSEVASRKLLDQFSYLELTLASPSLPPSWTRNLVPLHYACPLRRLGVLHPSLRGPHPPVMPYHEDDAAHGQALGLMWHADGFELEVPIPAPIFDEDCL